jgi:uncharacterized protein (TIGR02328 family)
MRLWHYKLLSKLPRQQLLGQHRECCALRGNGWGRRHVIVDYVFEHSPAMLYFYHVQVMCEMALRGYQIDPLWKNAYYRGKKCEPWEKDQFGDVFLMYPEHDDVYLADCVENLQKKGIELL